MTREEEAAYTQKLKENIHLFVLNYIKCPTCQELIPKPYDDPKLTRTHCDECEEAERGRLDFCYKCGEEWKYGEICLSDFCTFKKQNSVLQECIEIAVDEVRGVPAVRACPNCYTLYEHMEACRHMKCKTPKCKDEEFEYCHICLSNYDDHDSEYCVLAPRQVLVNPHAELILYSNQEEQKEEEPTVKEDIKIHDEEIKGQSEEGRIQDKNEVAAKKNTQKILVDTDDTDYNEHYDYAKSISACSIF
ncbi:hypothetical protein FGO68_gene12934 [Halteria grandinella]|uniref:RING-type domain-containing protein n=1 Tax=Halteria grandinella TaxID=5974 RepID=A0A8J8NR48_HALGN|nr:hypothetical protein FGO68_gene12934 [Halteria grandinella]